MARIRSIHPSFFTDEACVSCSPLARLLYIGLWTDADDQGLFEWKPLQLKMRLLPGDNADAAALLAELVEAELIAEVPTGGKRLGAIRDFRTYQRPKKPNAVHAMPDAWRTYVGLTSEGSEPASDEPGSGSEPSTDERAAISEPVPNQFPTGGENPPQMEDGGEDVRKEEREESFALVAAGATTSPGPTPADVQQAFDAWNAMAARSNNPKALSLTKDRRAKLQAKLREVGMDGWAAALAKVEASPHCQGQNDRGWRADIDFLFQQRSWNRLMEGSYDGSPSAANQNMPRGRATEGWSAVDQAVAGYDWNLHAEPEDAA